MLRLPVVALSLTIVISLLSIAPQLEVITSVTSNVKVITSVFFTHELSSATFEIVGAVLSTLNASVAVRVEATLP